MFKLIILFLFVGFSKCSILNNVRYLNETPYILNVLQEVVYEVEKRQWCNLKIPDITVAVNETVFTDVYEGTVLYNNAFVASIQKLAVLESSVHQVWTWDWTSSTATVSFRGNLIMYDLVLGFDVTADMQDGAHHYTAVLSHQQVNFAFNIDYNIHNDEMSYSVTGTIPTTNSVRLISFMPTDKLTEVLTTMFTPSSTHPGILAWGDEVFLPILKDVVTRVEFPTICYDCPA